MTLAVAEALTPNKPTLPNQKNTIESVPENLAEFQRPVYVVKIACIG